MGNIKIRKGEFKTRLELIHSDVAAGFPILTDDYSHDPLDFNRDFIKHPEASYYGEVEGESTMADIQPEEFKSLMAQAAHWYRFYGNEVPADQNNDGE